MNYIIYGYIFITSYNWVAFKEDKNYEHIIVKAIVSNYVLKNLYKMAYINSNIQIGNQSLLVVMAAFASFFLGITIGWFSTSLSFNQFLHDIKIGRTTNNNIWDDVIKGGTWLRIYMKNEPISYLGQYLRGEAYEREPIILLYSYQILDPNGKILADYSKDSNECVLLNTKDFEKIEITYSEISKTCYEKFKNWF